MCLGNFVADGFADLVVGLTDETVGGGEPAQVGYGLQVPDDDVAVAVHEVEVWHKGRARRLSGRIGRTIQAPADYKGR
jgi:hypothetical protein